tara:strand:- start:650 stop:1444 length:795 start_codon:yes stop_codon:yes gene_type:complete
MAAMMTMVSVAKTEVHPLLAAGVQQAILLAEISIAFAKGCADALPGALKNMLDKIPIEAVAAGVVIVLILGAITGTSTTGSKKSKKGKGSKDDSDSDSISSEAEEILEELIDLYIEEHEREPTEDEFLKWTETLKQATVDHASSPKKGKKTPTKKAAAKAKAGKKGELVPQKSPAKSASKSSKKAAAPKKVASSDSKAAVVFAEECVKWQKALPAKEQAKLEKQLAAAKTPAQSKAAFLASAAADKTKGRAARKEALLKAAMKV